MDTGISNGPGIRNIELTNQCVAESDLQFNALTNESAN